MRWQEAHLFYRVERGEVFRLKQTVIHGSTPVLRLYAARQSQKTKKPSSQKGWLSAV
jgi:hypothetical protein